MIEHSPPNPRKRGKGHQHTTIPRANCQHFERFSLEYRHRSLVTMVHLGLTYTCCSWRGLPDQQSSQLTLRELLLPNNLIGCSDPLPAALTG